MDSKKYIGMDVHKESISIAVRNGARKMVMECVIETKASMILRFIDGLHGDLQVTFEEGTSAAWLYDLLKPPVTKLLVCDPRKNASMREGHQSDKNDAPVGRAAAPQPSLPGPSYLLIPQQTGEACVPEYNEGFGSGRRTARRPLP